MLKTVVSSVVAGEVRGLAKRIQTTLVFGLLAAVLVTTGIGFLVGAGYIAAAERFGALEAALGFGAGFIIAGVLAMIISTARRKALKRRQSAMRGQEIRMLAAAAVAGGLPALLKSRSGLAGLLLPAIGLLAVMIYRENSGDADEMEAGDD